MLQNIIEQEDFIKGLPDAFLYGEMDQPSGQLPQFLVLSEIQRRTDMRERYEATQEQPQGTISEQIISEGLGGMMPDPMTMGSQTMGSPIPTDPTSQVPAVAAGTPPPPTGGMGIGASGLAGMGGQPQGMASGGIIGMANGGTAGGASNMVAAVNAAIDQLRAEGRDPSVYSQYELRKMGEEILGTDRPPTLQQQGYRQHRPDLGADYELQSMDYGLLSYDPAALSNRAIDAVAGLVRPSGASEAARRIERGEQERYGAEAEQRGRDVAQFIREDEQLGILGAVVRGAGNVVGDAWTTYMSEPAGEIGGAVQARWRDTMDNLRSRDRERLFEPNPERDRLMVAGMDDLRSRDRERLFEPDPERDRLMVAGMIPELDDILSSTRSDETDFDALQQQLIALDDAPDPVAQDVATTEDEILSVVNLLGEDYGKDLPLGGTGNDELADALSKRTPSALETDLARSGVGDRLDARRRESEDLIEQIREEGRRDAFSAAMMQLGAGVAGGDMSGGLQRAGEAATSINSLARDAARAEGSDLRDYEERLLAAEQDAIFKERGLDMEAAGLEIDREKLAQDIAKDASTTQREAMRTYIAHMEQTNDYIKSLPPQERMELGKSIYKTAQKNILGALRAELGETFYKAFEEQLPQGETGEGGADEEITAEEFVLGTL